MATVYLPLGYPVQSGTFSTLVFQGQVVRLYMSIDDPRTDTQIFRRKLLGDVTKMRAVMGEYAKRAQGIQFGSKWGAIINQMCMGDVDGLWSTAWGEWDSMSQSQRNYLNDNAPFVATWNMPGRVYWALYQTLYNWNEAHGGNKFHMPLIVASDPDEGWIWWRAKIDKYDLQADADVAEWSDSNDGPFMQNGSWSNWTGTGPRNSTMRIGSTVGGYLEINAKYNHLKLWHGKNTDRGNIQIYYDDAVQATINSNGAESYQNIYDVGYVPVIKQPVRFIHGGPAGKIIDVDGVEVWINYKGEYLELDDEAWTVVNNAGAVDGYYHFLNTVGFRIYHFNFVGRYAKIYFPMRPEFSTWSFHVDGLQVGTFNAYSASEVQGASFVIGPFRKTLHRCEVRAPGGKVGVDVVKIRNYKKDL